MMTVFDATTRQHLISRLGQVSSASTAAWGKMNAAQMLRHCRLWEEMIHGNKHYPRSFIGRIIGQVVLKQILKGPQLRRSTPTIPEMVITVTDIDHERQKIIALLHGYATYNVPGKGFIHPFFGTMTRQQVGVAAYMHLDHHLRQFGA